MKIAAGLLGLSLGYCGFREVHKEARKGVVTLHYANSATGNCIAISPSGLAITTKHCTFERSTTEENQYVEVISTHPQRDLAVVQLPRHKRYSYLKLGDSERLEAGEEVLLCGYGYKSFLCHSGFVHDRDDDFLYASTLMMHGQSGGAVLNTAGEVVGINKAHHPCSLEYSQQKPFHKEVSILIPVSHAKELLADCCEETKDGWRLKPLLGAK